MNEMVKYYFDRTVAHIRRVQDNAFYLINNHADKLHLKTDDCRRLAYNIMRHDASKFSEEQFGAYVIFSWKKKNKEDLSYHEQCSFEKAWDHHYRTENHHPERLRGIAEVLLYVEMIEIVCDLQAMSQEFGQSSCREYFENTWCPKQEANFYDLYQWELTKNYMRRAITCLESRQA